MATPCINIRPTRPVDENAIEKIHTEAFSNDVEARLVHALEESSERLISLVAEDGDTLVGHILFSPVTLTGDEGALRIMGLAPMAVLPSHQRKGIGTRLVEEGLKRCQDDGYDAVVVLGHADYYPRFGFRPADEYDLTSEYEAPPGAFMVKELKAECLKGHRGTIQYHAAFSKF